MKLRTLEFKGARKNGIVHAFFVALSIIIETVIIILPFLRINKIANWIDMGFQFVSVILALAIYSQHKTSSMKMPWIFLILLFPVPGIVLYLFLGLNGSTKKMAKRYADIDDLLLPKLPENYDVYTKLKTEDKNASAIARYIRRFARYPVYQNTDVEYFDEAWKGLDAQLEALAKAQKFIFMEYHAIEDKESWARIENVLVERVNAGVEVRVFYDDVGSMVFINHSFVKKLEALGIRCKVFNPIKMGIRLFINNRDHRKITVIDGKVGFTGGYNLANEYFGVTHPYGEWKDTGIKLTGDAVKSMTAMFLEMWNAVSERDINDTEYDYYLEDHEYVAHEQGYVQPYADSPMDNEHVGEDVYVSMANKAIDYCYFITPYLIITDEMLHALKIAAKRGVDVRIVTPGIPDKKIVYSLTRSFYHPLVSEGVKIYEWSPGFCHCKMSVADDVMATCGTINLDYRSLYHHFENGCFMYGNQAVKDIKTDFDNIFKQSRDVTELYKSNRTNGMRFGQMILRLFAELM